MEKLQGFDSGMLEKELAHTVFHGKGNLLKGFSDDNAAPVDGNAFKRE